MLSVGCWTVRIQWAVKPSAFLHLLSPCAAPVIADPTNAFFAIRIDCLLSCNFDLLTHTYTLLQLCRKYSLRRCPVRLFCDPPKALGLPHAPNRFISNPRGSVKLNDFNSLSPIQLAGDGLGLGKPGIPWAPCGRGKVSHAQLVSRCPAMRYGSCPRAES